MTSAVGEWRAEPFFLWARQQAPIYATCAFCDWGSGASDVKVDLPPPSPDNNRAQLDVGWHLVASRMIKRLLG